MGNITNENLHEHLAQKMPPKPTMLSRARGYFLSRRALNDEVGRAYKEALRLFTAHSGLEEELAQQKAANTNILAGRPHCTLSHHVDLAVENGRLHLEVADLNARLASAIKDHDKLLSDWQAFMLSYKVPES